ncbi:Uptake hydrogenase 1, large subunit [Parafrankia sp. Ea1.12]|uniref:nickel-dependent hydrogenase large subunit n=1 Tax=Parafrankia sp. Ea1.12 TaxID=573499 RepID=UPI000DA4FBA9|nr:nickel-dependent hydrogenase large subunit [Parafrankia sp. Ea1.12]SQD95388.1 Uptake hydrogenase 1, large subunit [Parafrankia sp. Ea1.12]
MSRLVIDPVSRIEGHLRVEVQVDGGQVTEAYASSTMWRGIETILTGRDPRDAWLFAQRICGVCTSVHALASVRAVEDAVGAVPPLNARLLRDLIATSLCVHDHVVHFYHLQALDWVDPTAALAADPVRAAALAQSISDYPRSTAGLFASVQTRLKVFLESGKIGPFTNGYWGHPAYRLSPELNLIAFSHYLDALDFQRDYIRVHALLGGKNPHPQTYVVGGMASPIDLNSQDAINANTLQEVTQILQRGLEFVEQVFLPDLQAIGAAYPEWTTYGRGLGSYMVFGDYSLSPPGIARPPRDGLFPGGIIRNGNLSAKPEPFDPSGIAESVAHSWFRYDDPGAALPPWKGETTPQYTGPEPPFEQLDVAGKYTWLKAPRYQGAAMEVGPVARMLVGYTSGDARIRPLVQGALDALRLPPEALMSTLGRVVARGLETRLMAQYSLELVNRLRDNVAAGDLAVADTGRWRPTSWPEGALLGVGFHEAPRGSLSHWVVIEDGRIRNYQAVVPTTWNASPRDAQGNPGAYEAALVGTPVADPQRPLEILRTLHSFDPCMACAAHIYDAEGRDIIEVRVQ